MAQSIDMSDLFGPSVGADTMRPPAAVAAAAGGDAPIGGVSYDGSSVFDQLALWNPSLKSSDAAMLPEKNRLDARSQDTMRNDAYAAGGARIIKDSIVGATYRLNARPSSRALFGKADDVWEAEFQEEVETKFGLWAESPSNWVDAARRNTLTTMVRLAIGVYVAGGELLLSAEWMKNDGRPFRTAMQFIDTARLSTPLDKATDPSIRNGVERDYFGAPVAYHIRNAHPSEGRFTNIQNLPSWRRVPTSKPWGRPMMLHVFEQMGVDQSRGVAAMVSALSEMRMAKNLRKNVLQQAVIAATYAATLESDLPDGDVLALMGSVGAGGDDSNPGIEWMAQYMTAVDSFAGGSKNLHIDGVRIPTLPPGTKLNIQNPGAQSPIADKFEQSLLRHISAAIGTTYEQLSHDYSNTNYSSARAAMLDVALGFQAQKKLIADKVASFGYRLWLEEAINYNRLECLKRRKVPAFYEGQNAEAYTQADWIGAGTGQIDPLKETQASMMKLKAGLSTKEIEIARLSGGDWRAVAKQIARERANDEALGNPSVYDTPEDPNMVNSLNGTPSGAGK